MRRFSLFTTLMIMLFTVCSGHVEDDFLLRPGVGCGVYLIGKTKCKDVITQTHDEEYYARKGIWFECGSDGRLESIVTDSSAFRTDKGIRRGDPEELVEKRYGKGTVVQYKLSKGDTVIGTVGDYTLVYPGIRFIVVQRKVRVIEVGPN